MDKRAWIYLHTNMTLLKCCLQIRIHKSTKEANLSIGLHELSNQLNMDALSHLLHHLLLNYGDDWLFSQNTIAQNEKYVLKYFLVYFQQRADFALSLHYSLTAFTVASYEQIHRKKSRWIIEKSGSRRRD